MRTQAYQFALSVVSAISELARVCGLAAKFLQNRTMFLGQVMTIIVVTTLRLSWRVNFCNFGQTIKNNHLADKLHQRILYDAPDFGMIVLLVYEV